MPQSLIVWCMLFGSMLLNLKTTVLSYLQVFLNIPHSSPSWPTTALAIPASRCQQRQQASDVSPLRNMFENATTGVLCALSAASLW